MCDSSALEAMLWADLCNRLSLSTTLTVAEQRERLEIELDYASGVTALATRLTERTVQLASLRAVQEVRRWQSVIDAAAMEAIQLGRTPTSAQQHNNNVLQNHDTSHNQSELAALREEVQMLREEKAQRKPSTLLLMEEGERRGDGVDALLGRRHPSVELFGEGKDDDRRRAKEEEPPQHTAQSVRSPPPSSPRHNTHDGSPPPPPPSSYRADTRREEPAAFASSPPTARTAPSARGAASIESGLRALQSVRAQLRALRGHTTLESTTTMVGTEESVSVAEGLVPRHCYGSASSPSVRRANSTSSIVDASAASLGAVSPWKDRLVKLQRELVSLRTELGQSAAAVS